ncbi:MAG: hypothetical protein IKR63_06140 [Alloprevotella sp.]|nr:hypothetical protein [Alloprevotella sp.]
MTENAEDVKVLEKLKKHVPIAKVQVKSIALIAEAEVHEIVDFALEQVHYNAIDVVDADILIAALKNVTIVTLKGKLIAEIVAHRVK